MRLQIRNCVRDARLKHLRAKGKPVFKPIINNVPLLPGSVRILNSDVFSRSGVTYLASLVKSGSCEVTEVGVGPVNFEKWLSTFPAEVTETLPQEPVADDVVVELPVEPEPKIEEESEEKEEEEEEEEAAVDAAPAETKVTIYSEKDLQNMKNADLRAIILEMDPDASIANKSKKRLIALLLELQNA